MALMYDSSAMDAVFHRQELLNSPMMMMMGSEIEAEMEVQAAAAASSELMLNYSDGVFAFPYQDQACFDPVSVSDGFCDNDLAAAAALLPFQFAAPKQESDLHHHFTTSYPKRQKTLEDSFYCYDDSISCSWFDDFAPVEHPGRSLWIQAPEAEVPPLLNFPQPPVFCTGMCVKKEQEQKCGGEKSLTMQSLAARQRRRRITEKTQELGKLVPGGQKMNTAEMFHAAYKYISFLKSQVAILEVIGSFEEKDLESLVGSPLVQEKLYSTEKCLVPKNFVETLATDQEFQKNPQVLKEVQQLIQSLYHAN